jgi:hypothetical protein
VGETSLASLRNKQVQVLLGYTGKEN